MTSLEILPTGAWTDPDERNHRFDAGLCGALVEFFIVDHPFNKLMPTAVIDLGCGPGRYVKVIDDAGRPAWGYDGNRNLAFVCQKCFHVDLTNDAFAVTSGCDWILFLEVGEHIPAEHEEAIWRHLRRARKGVILSWAPPGQSGHGHVNCREPAYIGQKMAELGFVEGDAARFRGAATLPWFKTNLRIFTRP